MSSNRVVAAVAACWRHDWAENQRILAELQAEQAEAEALEYFQLMGLALVTLADQRFPDRTRAEVIRYIGHLRQRYKLGPLEMDPRLLERVITDAWTGRNIMEATANGHSGDDIAGAVTVVLDALVHDAGVLDNGQALAAFISDLRSRLAQRGTVDLGDYPDLAEALRPYQPAPETD